MKKEKAPIKLDGSDACGLEGVGERPIDCLSNPWRYPQNHRPKVCEQCPTNSQIHKVANMHLPQQHIIFKQTQPKKPIS